MAPTSTYRLPRAVVPKRYVLELAPDLQAFTFEGRARIDLNVGEAVTEVVLNAAELDVSSATLTTPDGVARPATVTLDADLERARFGFAEPVPAGPASLDVAFTGILNDQLHGFYRSTFVDADGKQAVIATTQFESTDARRAFPCWDEPDFKATFAVSLVVPEDLAVVSSGRELSSEPLGDGRRRVTFAETMPMSTYILAWVVGPFELTQPVDVDGVPLRVVAPLGRAALTPFAVEVGSHALRFFSGYFGIPYPSDKIDHVAIPDFAFGAMENLGCVTYREMVLLADLDRASQTELERIAHVVCHETAHMWFGNLVTMRWWNGIWLNEAFATFMELKATEAFRPEWQPWSGFAAGKGAALATDGLRATRPVEFEVGPPVEAEAMFDVLTYQKGGSVLRMLEQYLGEETFRKGIARYLDTHRHGNTETADLWDALEAESGEPVRATMDSWILQGGYPLVSVKREADGTGVALSQQRFLYAGESGDEHWAVPVNLRASVGGEVVHRRLLLTEPAAVDLGGPVEWVVVNEGGWGFYRVRYEPALLERLAADIQGICDPLERLGLVGDAWAAVMNGSSTLASWVALVEQLEEETDPDVWGAVASPLTLLDLVADEADRPVLQAFVRRIAGPAFSRVGWDPEPGESERTAILRGRLITLLGTVGADPTVRSEALDRLRRAETDPSALDNDVVSAAVAAVAASGGRDSYDMAKARYLAATTPQDEIRYQMALAGFPEPELCLATLNLAISDEVRTQDGPFLISGVLLNRAGGASAWAWVEEHLDAVLERFPSHLLLRVLEGIVGLVDPDVVARVHAFFASHDLPVGSRRLDQLQERMDVNSAFATRVRPHLANSLGAG